MLSLTVKLIVVFACFSIMYLSTEAAKFNICRANTATLPCIPGLPRKDGQPGRDGTDGVRGPAGAQGPPGLPGALNYTEQQQLREDILATLREEISMLSCCSTSSSTVSTTSQVNNPTESVSQPSSTLQPTPSPEPQCEVATSCKELYHCNPALPSGYYNIVTPQGVERVYCEMDTTNCGNITGGWMRAAYIDMTNVSNICPQGLTYTVASSTRMCTRSHTGRYSCSSVTFPTHGVPYTKVCGRARGYQFYATEGFSNFHNAGQTNLTDAYVSGLSVTSGNLQNHIWTFAAGPSKDYSSYTCCNCPCSPYPGPTAPPFVGEHYFCESGNTGRHEVSQWHLDDPLWDSQGCASGSTCCDRGGPWFTTTLNQEASSNIEVRMCSYHVSGTENIGVDGLKLYIY